MTLAGLGGAEQQFVTCFTLTFTLLGLKLLFGEKAVTVGSSVLLACVSASVATAWVEGTGAVGESGIAVMLNGSRASAARVALTQMWKHVGTPGEEPELDAL